LSFDPLFQQCHVTAKLMRRLEPEGHAMAQRGGRYFMEDFKKKLVPL